MMPKLEKTKIGVIGLGYVGLPLAVEFGKQYPTVGFDISAARIEELRRGVDATRETEPQDLAAAAQLSFSAERDDLEDCNVFVVTVPTPIGPSKRPELTPLKRASETVGQSLRRGSVVIYESTV